jgi:hypothetical protein
MRLRARRIRPRKHWPRVIADLLLYAFLIVFVAFFAVGKLNKTWKTPKWVTWAILDAAMIIVASIVLFALACSVVRGIHRRVERKRAARRHSGCCVKCGYDISAISGECCPECNYWNPGDGDRR